MRILTLLQHEKNSVPNIYTWNYGCITGEWYQYNIQMGKLKKRSDILMITPGGMKPNMVKALLIVEN
jgi:hypothetical protein